MLVLLCIPVPLWADVPDAPDLAQTKGTSLETAHLAVLVSECVVPVGGTASSEVFVQLKDVRPGIEGLRLVLTFDPQIVHVEDADQDALNGTQVVVSQFFEHLQNTVENQADNVRGEIKLALAQGEGTPIEETVSWRKVAMITWIGQQAGNSAVTVGQESRFTAADGQTYPPSAWDNATVYARLPGQIRGRVLLQGRDEHASTQVTSSLSASRVDRTDTELDGSFVLTVSHGEGFYTVSASAAGYLTAQGSRPIKLTVGSEIDLGTVTLQGGDVNGDDVIDIRDLSFVAYHLGGGDVQADANVDGKVDILDLTMLAGNFGEVGPTTWPIPE
jgi:hypothetical protein